MIRSKGGVRMSQSTLAEMNAIEQEAREIYESYQQKIVESKEQIAIRLNAFVERFDQETRQQIEVAKNKVARHEQEAKVMLADNVANNQQQLVQALGEKKEELIQQIVEKVVKYYGD